MLSGFVKYLIFSFLLISSAAIAQNPSWEEVAPGVWKAIAGVPDKFDLLKAAGVKPNVEALSKMVNATFPISKSEVISEIFEGMPNQKINVVSLRTGLRLNL